MEGLTLEVFRDLHAPQLQAIGFPQSLVPVLFSKLSGGLKDDPGGCLDISPAQSTEVVPSTTGYVLKNRVHLQPDSDVFVIQHVWESDGGANARKQLFDDQELLVKVEGLLGIEPGGASDHDHGTIRDEMVNIVCKQSGKSEKVARRALADSNYDLTPAIVTAEDLTDADCEETETKSEPEISFDEFKHGMMTMTNLATTIPDGDLKYLYEDYLKKKTLAPVEDDNGVVHCGSYSWTDNYTEESIIVTVPLPAGTRKKDIISKIHPRHWTVGVRGSKPIIDRDLTSIVVPDESFWTLDSSEGISMAFQKAHPEESWKSLLVGEVQLSQKEMEKVARIAGRRMAGRVQVAMERMWFVNQTYQAVTPKGDQKPVWYLMDKYGLGLTHSNTPNFSCKPFANAVSGEVMSLVWPVREVKEGEICTRDFVPMLCPEESSEQRAARTEAILGLSTVRGKKQSQRSGHPSKPTATSTRKSLAELSILNPSQVVKLYASGSLTDWRDIKGYTLVNSAEEADIILGDVTIATPRQFVARLVGDDSLVNKRQLCQVARGKEWFAQGVDLTTEAAAILCDESLVTSWRIVLPGERGAPVQPRVTRNKLEMIRCAENGSCVASQFCLLTALHDNRRYCLQFSVVVKCPKVFLHSCPRVRVAEREAADFDPWDTAALLTSSTFMVQWVDFLKQFTSRYKASWTDVQGRVNHAIRELFTLALSNCTGTQAMYSVDILLKHPSLDPVVIGVDPLPAFPNSTVAKQCLDLLVGRTAAGDDFEQLLPTQ